MTLKHSNSASVLKCCWPKKPLEIVVLLIAGTTLVAAILLILSSPFDQLDLSQAFVCAFLAFCLFGSQVGRLIKVTRTLRFLKSPKATKTLCWALTWLALIWGLICTLFCLFDGVYACLLALTLTSLGVATYAQAFYLPAANFWGYGAFPWAILQGLKYFNGWLAFVVTALAMGLALMAVRTARATWQKKEFGLGEPKIAGFNIAANANAGFGTRTANLSAQLTGEAWPDMLRYFGLGTLRKHMLQTVVLIAIAGAAAVTATFWLAWDRAILWLGALPILASVIIAIGVDSSLLALYRCKKERAFLSTLPGLPTPANQSKSLYRDFWLRIALPYALLLGAVAMGSYQLDSATSTYFFLTILASALITARMFESRIARYAVTGELDGFLGIIGPLIIVFGTFFALAGYTHESSVMFAGISAAIAAAAIFTPRGNKTALALTRNIG